MWVEGCARGHIRAVVVVVSLVGGGRLGCGCCCGCCSRFCSWFWQRQATAKTLVATQGVCRAFPVLVVGGCSAVPFVVVAVATALLVSRDLRELAWTM